jgi:hypothetical protein
MLAVSTLSLLPPQQQPKVLKNHRKFNVLITTYESLMVRSLLFLSRSFPNPAHSLR